MLAQVINKTPFPHFAFEKLGHVNEHWFTVIIKATCDIDPTTGHCEFSDTQLPIVMADKYRTTLENSSLLVETDLVFYKPRGEFYLTGTARVLEGQATPQWESGFTFGSLNKQLTLSGPRYWEYQDIWRLTDPLPITALPLIYEHAFGGHHHEDQAYPDNPIGLGWYDATKLNISERYAAAQISYPQLEHEIGIPSPVAGFGLYSRWWQQRLQYAGTYDDIWINEIRPYYPADFKNDFLMGTPVDQQQDYFKGDEILTLKGLFPESPVVTLTLPKIGFLAAQQVSHQADSHHKLNLDTVSVSLDERKLYLTWRYSQTDLQAGTTLKLNAYKLP
ncbi:DUF2169 family type VI secretion system accessory protein [Providencia sp. Je.9.19]|uniref:DUF2169 family type VI secretion system accessory protein n=1 Tax=Providencia sp. Je.9.19 TaxID=3142844 RepID=UPI003DA8A825